MTIYVLTREVNAYDQEGAYYEACFVGAPSTDVLAAHTGRSVAYAQWLLDTGGGRVGVENEWFALHVEQEAEIAKLKAKAAIEALEGMPLKGCFTLEDALHLRDSCVSIYRRQAEGS